MQEANQFRKIADYYDMLMSGVRYERWVDYIQEILSRFDYSAETVLDVACGTGNVSEILAKRGYDVTGIDIAGDMIDVAKKKNGQCKYFTQDMAELSLEKKDFDLAISLFDSLNYVTDTEKLQAAMKSINQHLKSGGVFIFDINTIYALAHHFFDQMGVTDNHNPKYVWRSVYDYEKRICTVNMTFQVNDGDEVIEFKETHIQRGHTPEELTSWLGAAGFDILDVYHAYRFRKPTRRSDRLFFVCKKR